MSSVGVDRPIVRDDADGFKRHLAWAKAHFGVPRCLLVMALEDGRETQLDKLSQRKGDIRVLLEGKPFQIVTSRRVSPRNWPWRGLRGHIWDVRLFAGIRSKLP